MLLMKMNVWHFLVSYQLTCLLPCKVFSSLLLFQTKYFQFLLSSSWPTRRSSPSCRRPWPGSSSRTTTMGRRWAGKGEIGSQETHCNGEAEKTDEIAQREAIGKAGKAKEEFHLLKAVFDLFKKVPPLFLVFPNSTNLWFPEFALKNLWGLFRPFPYWHLLVASTVVSSSVQRSEEFHSGTGRDGIEVQSRDPGIFRDGISLIFQSRDCLEIVRDFSGLTFFDAISDYLDY